MTSFRSAIEVMPPAAAVPYAVPRMATPVPTVMAVPTTAMPAPALPKKP